MEDAQIIDLYWARNQNAVKETQTKYAKFLQKIAYAVLFNFEDSEEAVNDTYLKVWNAIPQDRPEIFSSYLAKIVRRTAIDLYRRLHAAKRACEYELMLDELEESVTDGADPADEVQMHSLSQTIDRFLEDYPKQQQILFVKRYFYCQSVQEIADDCGMSQSNVKTSLFRMRGKLKDFLIQEGY